MNQTEYLAFREHTYSKMRFTTRMYVNFGDIDKLKIVTDKDRNLFALISAKGFYLKGKYRILKII